MPDPDPVLERLAGALHHPDRGQLLFQMQEVVVERLYLHGGITIREGDVVLDVGANIGVAAAFFAACGAGRVHSFEPVSPIYELLVANLATFPQCRALNVGVSNESRLATITYYPDADAMSGLYADAAHEREVAVTYLENLRVPREEALARTAEQYDHIALPCVLRTLSSLIEELDIDRVDLLKVDAERSELDVLLGLEERHWPIVRQVAMEVDERGGQLDTIDALLRSRGFRIELEQDDRMLGTGLHMLYGVRSSS